MSAATRGATLALSVLGLASKLLAVAKTMLIAALFGAGASLDAFWVAYSLPVLLPALLNSVVTVAFVPRFMRSLEGQCGPAAWRGANTLFTLILLLSLLSAIGMSVHAEALVRLLAPGLAASARTEAIAQTRLLLPCVPLLALSAILSAISNARERYLLPALEGVSSNIVVMLAALLLTPRLGIAGLTIGVLAGFVLQALLLLYANRAIVRQSLRPALALAHADFRAPAGQLLPLLVGSAGSIATGLINQYFLSRSNTGAISAMAYAAMVAFLPVEVFAQAVITSRYPALSRKFVRADITAAAQAYAEGVRLIVLLTLPCAIVLSLFAETLLVLLLERGSFDRHSTMLTANLTLLLATGLVFRACAFFNYRVLHAAQRSWLQVFIGIAGIGTHFILCIGWIDRYGASGVALAASVAMLQSALLSSLAVASLLRAAGHAALRRELARLALIALCMLCMAVPLRLWLWPATGVSRTVAAWQVLLATAGVAAAAAAVAGMLRQPDVLAFGAALRARLHRVAA